MPISLIPQPDATSIEFARRHAGTTLSPPDAGTGGIVSGPELAGGGFAGGGFATYLSSVMNAGSASRGAGDLSTQGQSARQRADSEGTRSHQNDPAKADKQIADDAPKQPEPKDTARESERADKAARESERAEGERAAARESERAEGERAAARESERAEGERAAARESERAEGERAAARESERAEGERAAAREKSGKAEAARAGTEAAEAARSRSAERDAGEKGSSEKGSSDASSVAAGSDSADKGKALAASAATKAAARAEFGERPHGGKRAAVDARRVTERDGRRAVEIDVRVGGAEAEAAERAKALDDEAKAASSAEAGAETERDADADSVASKLAADRASESGDPERGGGQSHGEEVAKADLKADAVAREREASRRGEPGREEGETRGDRRVEVRDLRARGNDARGGSDANRDNAAEGNDPRVRLSGESKATGEDAGSGTARGPSFESLRADGEAATGNSTRGAAAAVRSGGQTVELRRALNEQLNGEIVRSARLIVRGGDRGEIRLNLKPESLGSVRIALQMHDGHIAGRIIVDNQSVREAFEQNLAALQKAFAEGGMDASGLEVSVADSGRDSGRTEDGKRRRSNTGAAVALFDNAVPSVSSIEERHDLVDLVV